MDHSIYHNPDMPGSIKKNKAVIIDGIYYKYATLLLETGIFEDEDCTRFSDFELNDTTDECEECSLSSSSTDISTDEDDNSDEIDMVLKKQKREHDCHNIVPIVNIKKECNEDSKKVECYEKKKKEECSEKRTKDCCHSKEECCLKRKKTKRPVNYCYSSDDCISLCSSHSSICDVQNLRESSPTTITIEEYSDVKDQPLQLFGYFFCELCNLEMSSEKVYNDHMSGKRHRKNLKLKYVDKAVAQAIPPSAATEGQSKYPKPPHGVIRRKVKERAKIQDVIKNEVKKPCPGLHLVTEIQGIKETTYYCSVCNSICSSNSILSHLTGFKHQLHLVKYFRPGDYEHMSVERKNLIQDRIVSILRAIQKREGLGRMTVEVEELVSDSCDIVPYNPNIPCTSQDVKGPSLKLSGMSFIEYYDRATIPNKSTSDFYCEFCDSHMNSEDMWQAHITGKRHLTNLKKLPGERPSKTKTIPLPNARAKLLDRFEDECPDEPIVGLNEIREVQIRETNSVSYNCFLCCSCHTSMDIIEHLVSLKHRMKYLDHIQYPYMQFISGMTELSSTPIIRSICNEMEEEKGRGTPSVHMNKSAFY